MKKQHLPIECAENGRKAGRQVLLKLLIMIVCAAAVFGLFGGCGGSGENNPTDAPTLRKRFGRRLLPCRRKRRCRRVHRLFTARIIIRQRR